MAEYPFMPMHWDAYMLDCAHLSDAEHGRYLMILKELWIAPGNRIPDDPKWIARRFRRSVADAEEQIIPLLQEFCKCDGNWWSQKRVSETFSNVQKKSDARSVAAKSRWNKEKGACKSNATKTKTKTKTKESSLRSDSPPIGPPEGTADKPPDKHPEINHEYSDVELAGDTSSQELELLTEPVAEPLATSPPPVETLPAVRDRRQAKRVRTLSDLELDEDLRALADKEGRCGERELEKFRNYCEYKSKKYKDYRAAFRNWLMSEYGRPPPKPKSLDSLMGVNTEGIVGFNFDDDDDDQRNEVPLLDDRFSHPSPGMIQ